MSKRTAKQQARFEAANRRAQQVAQDRHIRIHNARIERLEQEYAEQTVEAFIRSALEPAA